MSKKTTKAVKPAKTTKAVVTEKLEVTPENINFLFTSGRYAEAQAMLKKHDAAEAPK